MLFPTLAFAIFFMVVYTGHWVLRGRDRLWKPFMLAASYFFYGYWDWRFLGLIAASSVVNHLLAVAMHRHRRGLPIARMMGGALLPLAGIPLAIRLVTSRLGTVPALSQILDAAGADRPESAAFHLVWALTAALAFLSAGRVIDRQGIAPATGEPAEPRTQGRSRVITLLGITSVVFNLVLIGFFKYYNFFVLNAYQILGRVGITPAFPLLDIILPVGISFFTFQAMSYVIDVWRGRLDPAGRLVDFSVYLAFFPQLVAGPIVRASVLLPQIAERPPIRALDTGRAAVLILSGLFKKVVVANYLAATIVDPVFGYPEAYGALDTLFAVYGYAIQIYCDFSAYSDIAIGAALLLGFHFPINFDAPYFSVSIQEFWRRWHISLSTWLRDYLYIPLGGSRVSTPRIYANLIIVFLLGGLWHGAGWTFIVWGLIHGVLLCAERLLGGANGHRAIGPLERGVRMFVTFHFVCLSWIFFRAQTFADAWIMLRQLGDWSTPIQHASWGVLGLVGLGLATHLFDGDRLERGWNWFARRPAWVQALSAAVVLTVIFALGPRGVAPFIYFQF